MATVIKALAVLGAIWAVCLGILLVLISLESGNFSLSTLFFPLALLFLFHRLYSQKRWASAAACVYCVWMVIGSFSNGILEWTLGWVLVACLMIGLVATYWKRLEPGL